MQKEIIISTTKEIMGTTMMTVICYSPFLKNQKYVYIKKSDRCILKVSNGYMERVTKLKLVSILENL